MNEINLSYSKKLFLLVLFVGLIPLTILSSILYVDKIQTETQFIQNSLQIVSETGSHDVYDWISERENNIYAIAQDKDIVSSTKVLSDQKTDENELFESRFELEGELEIFLENFPDFHNFILSDKDGKVLFYTDLIPPNEDLVNQNHFQEALKGKTTIGEIFLSSKALPNEFGIYEKGLPTFFISAPIIGEAEIEGILTARVNILKLNLHDEPFEFHTTDRYLVNSEGFFISKPKFLPDLIEMGLIEKRPELILKVKEPDSHESTEIFQLANTEKTDYNMIGYPNYIGNIVIGSITPVSDTNWSYITEVEKDEAFVGIVSIQLLIIYVISIAGLTIIGASLHFSSGLTLPIKKLQSAAEQITQGNLDIKTEINTKDEIGDLSRSFEHMAENLKKMTDIEVQLVLQQNLRKALDESSIVSILDIKGNITFVNDKFCQVSKYSKDEIIGKNQKILRSGVHPRGFYKNLWNLISNGLIWHGEICNKAKDGSLFWNETTIVPFSDKNGNIYEYVAIRNDITNQKNLAKKLVDSERLSAIGELSARISHDIRNPLTVIKNEIELLKLKNYLDENHTNRMENAMKRISHQIDEVLEYVRESPLQLSKFELTPVVNRTLDSLVIPSGVRTQISGDIVFMVADERKIEVVLVNLIFNAVQAVKDKGFIEIVLSETDMETVIQVIDSGPGIKVDPIEKIFDPLFTSKQKGTGLGLASVKNIVQQHGGTISVRNNPTTFFIKIPKKEGVN